MCFVEEEDDGIDERSLPSLAETDVLSPSQLRFEHKRAEVEKKERYFLGVLSRQREW
ncbi:hypothetical protein LJB68_14275 [bacterium 210820-DFI.6.52]|nr:hypothetical protein [bacterium 210820-DFI.6.52]